VGGPHLGQFMHDSIRPRQVQGTHADFPKHRSTQPAKEKAMLYTIAVVLLILWLLGFVSGYTMGAFIHALLVIALVLLVVQFVRGRRVV
jgi:Flp pilus assembly protein TadB